MLGLAMLVLVCLMTITVVDVTCRHTSIRPPWGAGGFEMSEVLMTQLACLALAWCWYSGGHIRVNMILDKCSYRGKAVLNMFGSLAGAIWLGCICWSVVKLAIGSKDMGSATDVLGIDIWPFQLVFALSIGIFALVLVRSTISYAIRALGHSVEPWTVDSRDT